MTKKGNPEWTKKLQVDKKGFYMIKATDMEKETEQSTFIIIIHIGYAHQRKNTRKTKANTLPSLWTPVFVPK